MAGAVPTTRAAGHERQELIADVDEGGAVRATTQRELEEPAVEGERLLDVSDLECDVIDADEPRHGKIRWRSPNSCHR
jgi:hypothetical protein